jgi:MinD-like ATPase involved in chromosome partitioning or flagellar assembly
MARYQITIADVDANYCEHFVNYVVANENNRIKAESITDAGYLGEFLNSSKKTDILLLHRDMYSQEMDFSNAKTVIVLSSDNASDNNFTYSVINKYQAANKLIDEILKIYLREHPNSRLEGEKNGNCKYIALYSPIAKSGKTVCALSLASALANQGNRVLYMSLEPFPSVGEYFHLEAKNYMSELIYYVKDKKQVIGAKIVEKADHFRNENLYIIAPFENTKELEPITAADWEFLALQLRKNSLFEYIIVDLPSTYGKLVLDQMRLADKIIFIESAEKYDQSKRDAFMKMLGMESNGDEIKTKLVRVMNQYDRNIRYAAPSGSASIPYAMTLTAENEGLRAVDDVGQMGRTLVGLVR